MDTGDGKFRKFDTQIQALLAAQGKGRDPDKAGVFEVGEKITLRGSHFVVGRITKRELVLFLQKRPEQ